MEILHRIVTSSVFLSLVLIYGCAAYDPFTPADQYFLIGKWKGTENTNGAKKASKNTIEINFSFNWYNLQFEVKEGNGDIWSGMSYIVDTETPSNIQFNITAGKFAGNISYGIYEHNDEVINLALSVPGFPFRPVSFTPVAGYSRVFEVKHLNTPNQIHIAYGKDPTTMMAISWQTATPTTTSQVKYGNKSGSYSNTMYGTWQDYSYKNYYSPAIHAVYLNNLKPNTKYYYICGDNNGGWSNEFSFVTAPAVGSNVRVTVFGDINLGGGIAGDPQVWGVSFNTLYWVLQDQSDFILHVGDIAYCGGVQPCWDNFFSAVQQVAATKPYMVCEGNHDVDPEPFGYRNRFFMPGPNNSTLMDGDYYYSFDVGNVHFVGFSTELWLLPYNVTTNYTQQMEWLANDLSIANRPENRKIRPWVIAFGHRPVYCSNLYEDCDNNVAVGLQRALEPFFYKYGVNMIIFGHIHAMEASYPISFDGMISGSFDKPGGPVYLTNGAAGQPFLAVETIVRPEWSAYRELVHGFSRLETSPELLHWEFVANNGSVIWEFDLANWWE